MSTKKTVIASTVVAAVSMLFLGYGIDLAFSAIKEVATEKSTQSFMTPSGSNIYLIPTTLEDGTR